jgi:hypothetical protein
MGSGGRWAECGSGVSTLQSGARAGEISMLLMLIEVCRRELCPPRHHCSINNLHLNADGFIDPESNDTLPG